MNYQSALVSAVIAMNSQFKILAGEEHYIHLTIERLKGFAFMFSLKNSENKSFENKKKWFL